MPIPRPKLNVLELALLAGLVAFVAFRFGYTRAERRLSPFLSSGASEIQELARRYGPDRNSEGAEEWIVRDFFQDRRDGVFLDVGANHYREKSNTYYLETTLGWSGIALEPQIKFAADYATYRPKTKFVPLFVSDVSNHQTTLFVPANDLMASSDRTFAAAGGDVTPLKTATTTLDDVLDRSGVSHVDFVSMDIELGEPAALAGFSIERFKPALVCVEAHQEIRQQLLDYFARHGYVVLGKYWLVDAENYWFALVG